MSEHLANSVPAEGDQVHDLAFWHSHIDETAAAEFLGVSHRTLQVWRCSGEGPRYAVIGPRTIRYTRADLRTYAKGRMKTSTSDPGRAA